MSKKQLVSTLMALTTVLLLSGCADRYDRAPQQPPTAKTYSVYKHKSPRGFHITQVPGVIDMISGLTR